MRQRIVLRGGVALITGAASGIGRALTLDLAGRGGALALLDRDAQGLAETGARAEALGAPVDLHGLDLADAAAIRALPAAIRARHGRLDLLVNNAGVALGGAFADTDLDDFEWVLDVNLRAPVRLIHALLPLLRESRPAWIVNVSSLYGIVAPPGQTAYCASKFGLRGFSESLRHELSGSGTGLTLVHPGGVATAIARNARLPRGADPGQAERLLCLVNAPADGDLRTFDSTEIEPCQAQSLKLLSQCGLSIDPASAQWVQTTPSDFNRLFPGTGGALYGPASHGWMTPFRRPSAASRVQGLFLAGGSVHPGPGVPMAALSGQRAAEALMAHLASTRRSGRVRISGGTSTPSAMTASTP